MSPESNDSLFCRLSCQWLISPWLDVFPNPSLLLGFHELIHVMNQFQPFFPDG
jgi:hypothetical protein